MQAPRWAFFPGRAPRCAPGRTVRTAAWWGAVGALVLAAGCEPTQPKPVAQYATPALPTVAMQAAVPPPATLAGLRPLVGSYPGERTDYLRQGALAQRLQRLLGEDYVPLLSNLGVSSPLVQDGEVFYITGNKPHEGGEEQAAVVVDPGQNALRVWLVHAGQERDWRDPPGVQVAWPGDVQLLQSNWRAQRPRRS